MNNKTNTPRSGIGPGPRMGAPGEKPKDFKGSLRKLLTYLGSYKYQVFAVMILSMCSTVFAIIGPKILGNATTAVYDGVSAMAAGTGGIDFARVGSIITLLAVLYGVSALLSFVQGFLMTGVSAKLTFRLRRDIDEKIHRLPFSYYDKVSNGEVLSRITNDVDAISQSFNQSITQLISSVTTLVGILVMMLSISWQMTLLALLTLPLSVIAVSAIVKRSQGHFVGQQRYLGEVNSLVEENYSCHSVVKAFCGEDDAQREFEQSNDKLREAGRMANFLSGLMGPVMGFIGNLGYVGVCIVGGIFASRGIIMIGDIQAFIQYMRQFTQPISQFSQISNILQQTMAAAERVFEFLEAEEEPPESKLALTVNHTSEPDTETNFHVNGEVMFAHVKFGYSPDKIIIKDFNAYIHDGERVAIVGPTGAGKTTVVKLLMRFYDVNEGAILVDGYDIRDFKRDDLRGLFGMVLQDTWLFSGTIADNIRYGKPDATDEEVIAAAKIARAHSFIRALPDGYNMIVAEDAGNLSEGQKQLITIARAVLADPEILILDEATSSVDTRTEQQIQKAMNSLLKGRTSFIIAHRLSTIRNADVIFVMNDGDIVEQGSHDELMAKNGFYAELYNSQFAKV